MKKTFSLLVLLFAAIFAQSAPVSIEKAHSVASKFLTANAKSNVSRNAEVVYTFTATDGTACIYVFNTDKGFVLVSADDHAYPILGYSEEGQFDIDQIPEGLNFQLNSFVEQIEWAIREDYITDDVVAQWRQVECDGNLLSHRNERTVDALIRDTWNQNCYYNDLCPYDKTVLASVFMSAAQVLPSDKSCVTGNIPNMVRARFHTRLLAILFNL